MDSHLHLLLRIDCEEAENWSEQEVVQLWFWLVVGSLPDPRRFAERTTTLATQAFDRFVGPRALWGKLQESQPMSPCEVYIGDFIQALGQMVVHIGIAIVFNQCSLEGGDCQFQMTQLRQDAA